VRGGADRPVARTWQAIFPVVLAGYGFPANPHHVGDPPAAAAAGLLQGPDVGAVEILDFDTFEQVEASAEQGGPSLVYLLANKQKASLRLAPFHPYMYFERRLELRRPTRIDAVLQRVFDRIVELHGVNAEEQARPA
jgi:hypothetical protein